MGAPTYDDRTERGRGCHKAEIVREVACISDVVEREGGPKSYMVRLASISPPFPFCRNATSVLSFRYNYATLRGNISHNCFPMHVYIMGAHDMWAAHRSLPPQSGAVTHRTFSVGHALEFILHDHPTTDDVDLASRGRLFSVLEISRT